MTALPKAPSEWSLYKNKSGQWVVKYRLPGDEPGRRSEHRINKQDADSKTDAQRHAKDWYEGMRKKLEAVSPERNDTPPKTIEALSPVWLTWRAEKLPEDKLAPATHEQDKTHLTKYIVPLLGRYSVTELTVEIIVKFIRQLTSKRKDGSCRANNTVRNVHSTLKTFLDEVVTLVGLAPMTNVTRHRMVMAELPKQEKRSESNVILDNGQLFALIKSPCVQLCWKVRYLFGALGGLRDGEIAALRFRDLHFEDPTPWVNIREALAIRGKTGRIQLRPTKTAAGKRKIPIHPSLLKALTVWHQGGWKAHVGRAPRPDDFVLPNSKGESYRPRSATILRRHLERAEVRSTFEGSPIEFHSLRATFLTWLLKTGVVDDFKERLVGHQSKTTAGRNYSNVDVATLAAEVAKIEFDFPVELLTNYQRPHRKDKGTRRVKSPTVAD